MLNTINPDNDVTELASIQNDLANTYVARVVGDRGENLEEAISLYRQALQVYTREAFPIKWATTQNNLANTYSNRIVGDRGENFEEAISLYHQVLQVRTRADFPMEWSTTQHSLATAYSQRMRGDRGENLEKAISHCYQTLEVWTREAFPIYWSSTQHQLAHIYSNRICGDRGENFEKAISHFYQALEIRTREDFPIEWARTQHDLFHTLLQKDRVREAYLGIQEVLEHTKTVVGDWMYTDMTARVLHIWVGFAAEKTSSTDVKVLWRYIVDIAAAGDPVTAIQVLGEMALALIGNRQPEDTMELLNALQERHDVNLSRSLEALRPVAAFAAGDHDALKQVRLEEREAVTTLLTTLGYDPPVPWA